MGGACLLHGIAGWACLLHGIAGCATEKPKTTLCVVFTSTCPKAYEMSISEIQSLLTYTERKTTWGFYECKLPCLVHFTGHDYWIIITWQILLSPPQP